MEISRNRTLLSFVFGLTKNIGRTSLACPVRSLHNSPVSKAKWFPFSKKKKKEPALPVTAHPGLGASSVFDLDEKDVEDGEKKKDEITDTKGSKYTEAKKKRTEHRYSTRNFHISPRKLRLLANQIARKPINEAIKQMEFSPKQASKKIMNSLVTARDHAWRYKAMDAEKCYIEQAWVGKGIYRKRPNYGARGRFSWLKIKSAHMKYIIKEKEPIEEVEGIGKKRKLKGFNYEKKKVWTPLIENKPIYNPARFYNW
ncbi:ribosomal protein L22/L17 [Glomus cerebriforme]|uniref:Ribosomal protein L22/L17 n=1 Tax=Glomus cerebriforme TaxID=658196 RepID=A0A397TKU1_9GLOM|nr:ribosomal protein L22/L17 [Glomus cerebriforme]